MLTIGDIRYALTQSPITLRTKVNTPLGTKTVKESFNPSSNRFDALVIISIDTNGSIIDVKE